ncbi:hypothetical protein [Rhizobium sp. PL01]|uniref:hypothetical protein n=1 Tax=Rhizobium sp. PL01 TaxID=3085631 RepID=UPI002981A366|nr:hypothetical protein [Rhizobium sp. PL01]MDW5315011.1 hypothetical protein [Rhizobium sp. PL01]
MKIKMLESMAGQDFSLSSGDITDRFSNKEAGRFIKLGIAEKAPDEPVKKPETSKEWDAERMQILDENAGLLAANEALKAREADLLMQIDQLSAFKSSVVSALGVEPAGQETAVKARAPEQR